jgi:glucoamylase
MKTIIFFIFIATQLNAAELYSTGMTPNWSSARKTQVGTSYSRESKLWFTNVDGILSEIYFPTIDTAQIKDSQILVSDGKSFFADEKYDTHHQVNVDHPSIVVLKNHHPKFSITHTYSTLRDKDVLVDEITIVALEDDLDFYLLVNTALNKTGYGDSGYADKDTLHFWENETNLYVQSNLGFKQTSIGYVGVNDGHMDIRTNYKLDQGNSYLENGNLAGTAQLNIPRKAGAYTVYITYGLNTHEVISEKELQTSKSIYKNDWDRYFSKLKMPQFISKTQENLYLRSLYTLKVHEDKINPGALIASLSKPWGEETYEYPGVFTGGYHMVWPRDHYHVSLALLLSGDIETPKNALGFLKRIQYQSGTWNFNNQRIIPKKGAFPQNVWTDLNEFWGGLQIDQVGYPIHLFWQVYNRLGARDKKALSKEYKQMVYDAAEFIFNYGPWSAQERWEENFGISPSSFSVATSALLIASKVLKDPKYKDTAHQWLNKENDNIHSWTFTTKGEYGDGNYYVRVAGCANYIANWNPNDGSTCTVANSGERVPMTKILDQGFLKLALLGLVPANDWRIKTSLAKINEFIRVDFKNKYSGWYRYSFDAYGENKKGRLWPLLSGEHGRYAIERYTDGDLSWEQALPIVDNILESYEFFANEGNMIPEQVYENTGIGTGGATPLAWSHAEFIKLLWSKNNKLNVENPF